MFKIELSKCYAIYDKVTGALLGVTTDATEETSIEISRELFRDISNDHSLFQNYIVTLDVLTSLPAITEKNTNPPPFTIADEIYLVPELTSDVNCVIEQDNVNRCWNIFLKNIENIVSTISPTENCYFSVTLLNDVHYLLRNFTIPTTDIINGISIPYLSDAETNNVSVYTRRLFGNYGLTTISN